MNSENKTWESLKTEYLHQVEKALSLVNHPRSKDVLEDVSSHLDRRFAELRPDQHSWENFQAIITDMGPPSEYAELLDTGQKFKKQKPSVKFIVFVGVIFAVLAGVMISLPTVCQPDRQVFDIQQSEDNVLPHPFVHDAEILGNWESVDFVKVISYFEPGGKTWQGNLFLKNIRFMKNGRTSLGWTWTKDWIWHSNGTTKAQYKISEIVGEHYLFLPWLSGNVTIRGQKPRYYVLKKVGHSETNTIVPGVRVGNYNLGMSKNDVLESLGKPKVIFYGEEKYTLNNLPRTYYMVFDDICFRIGDGLVKEITAISPLYKFANGLGVGDSEQKIKQAFGTSFHLKETKWKDFLTYEDKGLVFEIDKKDRTVMEINVTKKSSPEPRGSIKDKVVEAAISAAQEWLELIDNGEYSQSWDTAASYFKKAISKDQWESSLRAARQPLGKLNNRQVKSRTYAEQVPGAPDGQYVIMQFATSFENKKSATETVTPMLDEDGLWRVSGYYIK